MGSEVSQIQAIRSQALNQLQEVRSGVKPTYWIDGQRVHWEQYAESLQRTIDWCDHKVAELQPYEVTSGGAG